MRKSVTGSTATLIGAFGITLVLTILTYYPAGDGYRAVGHTQSAAGSHGGLSTDNIHCALLPAGGSGQDACPGTGYLRGVVIAALDHPSRVSGATPFTTACAYDGQDDLIGLVVDVHGRVVALGPVDRRTVAEPVRNESSILGTGADGRRAVIGWPRLDPREVSPVTGLHTYWQHMTGTFDTTDAGTGAKAIDSDGRVATRDATVCPAALSSAGVVI